MSDEPGKLPMAMWEFVTLVAFFMAVTALSVDIMLPVLPDIVDEFGLADQNDQQFMVTVYLIFFAIGQIFCGPISDRFGRKPVVVAGLGIYMAGTLLSIVSDSYAILLASRAIQGLGASAPRIIAVAVVRDRFVGRAMSQVMSFVVTVFIMLPLIAPALGASIGAGFGSWRYVFGFLFLFGLGTAVWSALRLPETRPDTGHDPVPLGAAVRMVLANQLTVGYMLALGFIFGCLLGYIASTQQVFADIYGIVDWFPLVFASVAVMMVVASLTNARLVRTVGMRRISHGAMIGQVILSFAALFLSFAIDPLPLPVTMIFLGLSFFLIGLILPNFNAMAMEPLGRVAGTGSSVIGFVMTGLGAVLGGVAANYYDQTLHPLLWSFAIYSSVVVIIVYAVEKGQILRPHAHPAE